MSAELLFINRVCGIPPSGHCDLCTLNIEPSSDQLKLIPGWCVDTSTASSSVLTVCESCLHLFFRTERWTQVGKDVYDVGPTVRYFIPGLGD